MEKVSVEADPFPEGLRYRLLEFHVQLAHQEREPVSGFLNYFGGRLARAMAGARFDPDEDRRRTRLGRLQGSRVLETVAWHNAVIVIRGRNQRGRIVNSGPDILERRVSPQRLKTRPASAAIRNRPPRPLR